MAVHEGRRIEAWAAQKGGFYTCPKCHDEVTLKKGRIVIHHFAHRPPISCTWASGETREHLLAKTLIRDAFKDRYYQAEVEVEVLSEGGDRRADVLLTNELGHQIAIEIQHTPILYNEMETRTRGYTQANIPFIWIGILTKRMRENAVIVPDGLEVEQYVIRPWEKWAHAYCYGELWYIDPLERTLWKGHFTDYMIYVEPTSWYDSYGDEQSGGGFSRKSRKWKTLSLCGPYPLEVTAIGIKRKSRGEWTSSSFTLPAGRLAHFR